jgi:8-hydroxy-5-deazaflavin:NADPH oxidoreductase
MECAMIARRTALTLFAISAAFATLSSTGCTHAAVGAGETPSEIIAIIGTGEVGGTLGRRWAALGYRIVYGSRTPGAEKVAALVQKTGHGATVTSPREAAQKADMILLAIPWAAAKEVVTGLGDLTGKIIIDPTNGVKVTQGRFEAPPTLTTSDAEEIQAWAASAQVVKAFNTLSVEMMADATRAGGPITVLLAGADSAAKARVAKIAQAMGLEPLDVGALYVSRYLEGMARLRMSYRAKNRPNAFEFYLRPRRD